MVVSSRGCSPPSGRSLRSASRPFGDPAAPFTTASLSKLAAAPTLSRGVTTGSLLCASCFDSRPMRPPTRIVPPSHKQLKDFFHFLVAALQIGKMMRYDELEGNLKQVRSGSDQVQIRSGLGSEWVRRPEGMRCCVSYLPASLSASAPEMKSVPQLAPSCTARIQSGSP